jgi:short-subunit dehydrogenase
MIGTALIVGAGPRLSTLLAKFLIKEGMGVVLAARDTQKLSSICKEIGDEAV